uniref:(northern house mosquito) hypothetical protein n=1 Tax=Culex pipiens TaxID=7175 RepID=A0A8D8IAG7_CULPI
MSRWQSIPIVCRSSSDSVRNTTRSISSRTITSMYRARSRSRKMLATVMRCSSCRLARGVPRMTERFRCSLAVIVPVDSLLVSVSTFGTMGRLKSFGRGVLTWRGVIRIDVVVVVVLVLLLISIGEMLGDRIFCSWTIGEKLRFRGFDCCLYDSNDTSTAASDSGENLKILGDTMTEVTVGVGTRWWNILSKG